jgi:protein-disulfide isomerase
LRQERDGKILTLPVGQQDHIRGPLSAAVTLVEYGDYECSHSGQAYTVVKENRQRLGSRLRFVFRHFPISQIHAQAQHAAEAAEAAGAQNKFWEMHDMLFEHQQALENGYLVEYAASLGLDTTKFLRQMSQHIHADRVRENFQSGMQSGVNATPTFFINGVRHDVPWDAETLLATIEEVASFDSREQKERES